MQYLEIKNLEKYHPGYKDRNLIWCKLYFSMINGDPEFEMLCEIDKWRFVAFVMLQIQAKRPIPLDDDYLKRKGIDTKKRPMSLTIEMLHNFVIIRNDLNAILYPREEKNREEVEKSRVDGFQPFCVTTLEFWNTFCDKHPILSKVKELSESRRDKLKKRFEADSFKDFHPILAAIEKQPFLLGENDRKWKVSFDWLIENDKNYLKVIELKYSTTTSKDFKKLPDPNCKICGGKGYLEAQFDGRKNPCKCTK